MHLRDGLQTHATVRQRYDHLVETGAIERDPAQERIAAALDRLTDEISAKRLAHKSSALGWLFARRRETHETVKGLYIHGGVGRGKTMLMDMFFELLPVRRKRRVAFQRLHGRCAGSHPEAPAGAQERRRQGGRPDPAGGPGAGRAGLGAVLRRILGHRHCRCDDPVAAVFGAVCQWRGAGRHLQCRAARISIATG